jgi:hypothetical protein
MKRDIAEPKPAKDKYQYVRWSELYGLPKAVNPKMMAAATVTAAKMFMNITNPLAANVEITVGVTGAADEADWSSDFSFKISSMLSLIIIFGFYIKLKRN